MSKCGGRDSGDNRLSFLLFGNEMRVGWSFCVCFSDSLVDSCYLSDDRWANVGGGILRTIDVRFGFSETKCAWDGPPVCVSQTRWWILVTSVMIDGQMWGRDSEDNRFSF